MSPVAMARNASRLRWLVGLLILGLFGYALVVLVWGASAVPGQSAAERRVSQYAALKRDVDRGIIAFLTVDHTRIEKLTAELLKHATGDFAKEYKANEINLKAAATAAKAKTTGEVKSIGIAEMDDDAAEVFVAADSVVKNATTGKVKKTEACPHDGKVCRYYRFKLKMTLEGDDWKIAKLEFVA